SMIIARTVPGLAAAREKGHFGGRRRVLVGARLARAQKMYRERPENPATGNPYTDEELAKLFKISRNTLYRYVVDGGVPGGKQRRQKFLAEHPDIDTWLEQTNDPARGTNPSKRRGPAGRTRVLTKEQVEADPELRQRLPDDDPWR